MTVRIGAGQAFWGDDITVPRWQIETGNLDYLVMDFLAELTMSILQRQRSKRPDRGYATDVLPILRDALPAAVDAGTSLIMNAGGVNPAACGQAVRAMVTELGLGDRVRVAVVLGDDVFDRIGELHGRSGLANMDTGEDFGTIADRVTSANVYLGSAPIAEALDRGANVVITGRCTDTALTLGPLMHEYGWGGDDLDLLAAGIVAGHLIECGPQATGGNYHGGWQKVQFGRIGYPIIAVEENGRMVLSKTPDSGGVVNRQTTIEQLIFEIEDPRRFMTPDVVADWTGLSVREVGVDEVEITGARGRPAPPTLKTSITYEDGFMTNLMWVYAAPDAVAKAETASELIEAKIARLGLSLDATRTDIFGCGAIHGGRHQRQGQWAEPAEVILRLAARSHDEKSVRRLAIEVAPMHFGPAGLAGYIGGGRGHVSEVLSHWPALIDRAEVTSTVELV